MRRHRAHRLRRHRVEAGADPVAGYDLTFSPVKSVSARWALAAPDVAREVQAAHEAAVRVTIGLLEREIAFTRVGKGGIRQVPRHWARRRGVRPPRLPRRRP
ncbi:MAG: relaxase domain-containing protein [Nostocoides sp.]